MIAGRSASELPWPPLGGTGDRLLEAGLPRRDVWRGRPMAANACSEQQTVRARFDASSRQRAESSGQACLAKLHARFPRGGRSRVDK